MPGWYWRHSEWGCCLGYLLFHDIVWSRMQRGMTRKEAEEYAEEVMQRDWDETVRERYGEDGPELPDW
jgi:hypothetical protein